MNKIAVRLITGLLLLLPFMSLAQEFTSDEKELISEIKKLMDDDELTDLVEAENSFEEGKFIIDQVENEEFTLEKYFAKGSTPKAEKKAVNVKAQRIEAARVFERAYVLMQGAFESRLSKGKWEFEEDQSSAEAMRASSTTKMEEAAAKTEDYKYLGEKDLATYPYEDLKTSIADADAMFLEALHYQFDAYILLLSQQDKKQKIADDNFAWGIAQRDNTQAAYQKYIDAFVDGIHVEEAQLAMATLASGDTTSTEAPVEETVVEEVKEVVAPVASSIIEPVAISNIPEETSAVETVVEEAPAVVAEPEPAPVVEEPIAESTPVAMQTPIDGVVFRIQFIAVRRVMSQEEVTKFYSGSEPVSVREEGGLHKYSIGNFKTFNEAREFRKSLDIVNFIVAFKDEQRVPINEAVK